MPVQQLGRLFSGTDCPKWPFSSQKCYFSAPAATLISQLEQDQHRPQAEGFFYIFRRNTNLQIWFLLLQRSQPSLLLETYYLLDHFCFLFVIWSKLIERKLPVQSTFATICYVCPQKPFYSPINALSRAYLHVQQKSFSMEMSFQQNIPVQSIFATLCYVCLIIPTKIIFYGSMEVSFQQNIPVQSIFAALC